MRPAVPDLDRVAREMAEVFVRQGRAASSARDADIAPPAPRRRGGQVAIILAVAAAGLAGLAGFGAGVLVKRAPPTPVIADAAPRADLAATLPASATPPLSDLSSDAAPAALAQASPTPGPAPASAVPQMPAKAPQVATRALHPDGPRPVGLGPPRRISVRPAVRADPATCRRNPSGQACRRAVTLADLHLRNVYQSAARRGVAQAALVDYRGRWAAMREDESDDPAQLIQDYGALAYDLGREKAR